MSVSGKKTQELNYSLEINAQLFVVYDERIYFILFQKSSTVWTKKLAQWPMSVVLPATHMC